METLITTVFQYVIAINFGVDVCGALWGCFEGHLMFNTATSLNSDVLKFEVSLAHNNYVFQSFPRVLQ